MRPGLPTPFAERVLDLVDRIPPGEVLTYGDVAAWLGTGGARAVGTALARYGAGVPWHRVVRADGGMARGHEAEAARRLRAEGAPLLPGGVRVDLRRGRWGGVGPPCWDPRHDRDPDHAGPAPARDGRAAGPG